MDNFETNDQALTWDNTLLSQVKNSAGLTAHRSYDGYVRESISPNTRKAYQSDLQHFQHWGGTVPCSAESVARYLAEHAHQFKVATLARRLATISKAHAAIDAHNPCKTELVQATMRGIRRKHGSAQRRAKPLMLPQLFQVLDNLPDCIRGKRDRALLLTGWGGGFRASELVGLNSNDISETTEGIVLQIRKSKTDQQGMGREIAIPFGQTRHCPVSALTGWLAALGISDGPLFRPINKHEHASERRLSADAVSTILCKRLQDVRIPTAGFSSHSLRAGFATSAAKVGVPTHVIRNQTGHASDAMLSRYIRIGERFQTNALKALL